MSRTLKRPMFRRGGSTNNGIMTGIVDRTKKASGDFVTNIGKRTDALAPEFQSILEKYTPKTKLPLGQLGFNLASGKFAGDGAIQNLIRSAEGPYAQFVKTDDARERDIRTGSAKLALGQAMKEAQPNKSSVLAAEKKARYLLPPDATADQIRAKTAEIIRTEMTGSTYSPQANLQRAIADYRKVYGEGSKAFNHGAFDINVAPELRKAGKKPRGNIKFKDGKYKTKGKTPGVYIDVENGKVIEFDGNIAVELPEYSALLR